MICEQSTWFGCVVTSVYGMGHVPRLEDQYKGKEMGNQTPCSCHHVFCILYHCCHSSSGIVMRLRGKFYRGADKSLARPTSRSVLFDGENISFDASLFICINSTSIPPIMIIYKIYETQNLLSL